ncbi:MAG: hypothetical protein ACREXP_22220, partial [Steroidobacteraceae bacterium]
MNRIASVEVLRLPAPKWRVPRWWATTALDTLFDERMHYRAQQIGLFNGSAEALNGQPVLLIVRVQN